MTAPAAVASGRPAGLPRERVVTNGVMGMVLFVFAEAMMFSGFISAHIISRRSALPGTWPPIDQPRLPAAATAFNTGALLLSGALLFVASRAVRRGARPAAERWLGGSIALGVMFVGLQGAEWARLLAQGVTVSSSLVGSYFYLIVGAHALHAVAALGFLASAWLAVRSGRRVDSRLGAARVFWYFVVLLWPVLYWKVYL